MNDVSKLVYSTQFGRMCPECNRPAAECSCSRKKQKPTRQVSGHPENDGIVRIQKEVKGRRGKCVSLIHGLQLDETELKQMAKQLKAICGSGGTIQNGMIIIQGDHRQKLQTELRKMGWTVKLAGG